MNVFRDAGRSGDAVRAAALATLLARQPEVKQVGTGAGYSCLTPWGVFVVTPDDATRSKTPPELDDALIDIIQQWVHDMRSIGMPPLIMTLSFDDHPAEEIELSRADAAALFKSLAAPISAAGFDPSCSTFIVSLSRSQTGEAIEVVSVTTAPPCDERTRAKLISAAKDWLQPRRCFLASIQHLHIELDLWAVIAGELDTAEAADLDVLGMPAAGRA